jgi:hypothetical protein
MYAYIINAAVLTPCYSDMFRPSEARLQGLRQTHFNSEVYKRVTRCKIQLSEQGVMN